MIEELTERELEVVAGVARGLTNQGIGNRLGISVEMVKPHDVNAKAKWVPRIAPTWWCWR